MVTINASMLDYKLTLCSFDGLNICVRSEHCNLQLYECANLKWTLRSLANLMCKLDMDVLMC